MTELQLTPEAKVFRDHFIKFVDSFIGIERHRERWKTLINGKEKKWGNIQIFDFPKIKLISPFHKYSEIRRENLIQKPGVLGSVLDNHQIVALRAGHSPDTGGKFHDFSKSIQYDYEVIFEGIISINAGKLAILIDHDDNAFVCEYNKKQ